eukprot:CAMPEP_0196720734 /NCGR_PEP_ID=MMETSP1091-20130531/3450_1 /TAXON_ID=302021 /ORGANISM="Rhodomonas sp., Strain CCMP768" /LENGTH=162 /DNA_ID=CAMNT_0042062047 /DNA_START=588 /DNA_END=1076 /DNA_ORIENTATION=+
MATHGHREVRKGWGRGQGHGTCVSWPETLGPLPVRPASGAAHRGAPAARRGWGTRAVRHQYPDCSTTVKDTAQRAREEGGKENGAQDPPNHLPPHRSPTPRHQLSALMRPGWKRTSTAKGKDGQALVMPTDELASRMKGVEKGDQSCDRSKAPPSCSAMSVV